MQCEEGKKYLITTDNWFFAPDGESYKAVFGTVHGIKNDNETLGIKTNRGSTNWFVMIGNMIIAGCQIHYCIQTEEVSTNPPTRELDHEGRSNAQPASGTRIYMADNSGISGK